PWESRFRSFLDNKLEDGERMWNSIQNGPYKRPMITNPDNNQEVILEPLSKITEDSVRIGVWMDFEINIQGVCGALDGDVSPPDDQDTAKLVKLVQIGPYGELDGVVSPSDELDTPKLVKLVEMGPSGELDGAPTLSDGRDTIKTVETNLVCTENL
ncbi:hypothetical protein Tco_1187917, partial [Tanacetum coccineum]